MRTLGRLAVMAGATAAVLFAAAPAALAVDSTSPHGPAGKALPLVGNVPVLGPLLNGLSDNLGTGVTGGPLGGGGSTGNLGGSMGNLDGGSMGNLGG